MKINKNTEQYLKNNFPGLIESDIYFCLINDYVKFIITKELIFNPFLQILAAFICIAWISLGLFLVLNFVRY